MCAKDESKTNNQCKNRTCADAIPSGTTLFNTDALCSAWLTGCVTNGANCFDQATATCASYRGSASQCNNLGTTFLPSALLKS